MFFSASGGHPGSLPVRALLPLPGPARDVLALYFRGRTAGSRPHTHWTQRSSDGETERDGGPVLLVMVVIISHSGNVFYVQLAPENTVMSFERAVEAGGEGLETDVTIRY